MDKNIIKNLLTAKFINEESTPGIDVTKKAQKESGKINKAGVTDMGKEATAYDKAIKKTDKTTKVPNKFNYNGDKEKEYHDEMEILNGQEMIQYDREPNEDFKKRALEALEGSTRMGNKGGKGVGNAEATWGASSDDFGKNLVKRAVDSAKKRQDAEYKIISFGDDIETMPKGQKPMSKFSAFNEGVEQASKDIESDKPYGTEDEYDFNNSDDAKKVNEYSSDHKFGKWVPPSDEEKERITKFVKDSGDKEEAENNKKREERLKAQSDSLSKHIQSTSKNNVKENNNNKPQIKESMKRLKFKKEFNGVGNALKMIPESYKTDNKVFEMTDGVESYKIRWEGTLSEGKAQILTASNKTMVNEDMERMKRLMGYKSQDTLGLVKGKSRLDENAIFNDILNKTKALLEGEDIEDQDAATGDLDDAVSHAKEAKKHVEGSVSTDKGTQAPKPKTGSLESLDDAKKQAPEATKHVEGSVNAKIGMGLGAKAKTGEWDQISVPQAAAHGTESSTTYAPAPKQGEWDKISVPQASDAKKHVHMGEGVKKKIN